MFILKHVLPLIIISLLFGIMIARVDFSSLFAASGPGVQQQSQATSEEAGESWSVDAFVDSLHKRRGTVEVDTRSGRDVAAQLAEVADRAKIGRTGDRYPSSILEEASDLTVTAVPAATEGLVRENSTAPTVKVVTVAKGESLIDIAVRVYGDPRAYLRIFEANRDTVSNPNQIFVGQKLRLPD